MKNPSWQTGSFRSRRVRALFDRVTGPKRDPATETPFQSSGIQSHSSSKIPPRTCYQWPLPVAHKRIRTIRNHELSSCWVQRSAKKGIPHMAKRATAHHSLLRLASVGLCNSGTGSPTAPLKNARRLAPVGQRQCSRTGCVSGAREVIGRKPIISADSPEQGGPSCVTTLFLT